MIIIIIIKCNSKFKLEILIQLFKIEQNKIFIKKIPNWKLYDFIKIQQFNVF